MNRKEAIVVGVLLLTLSIGGSYAATTPNAPATIQTTSVDIEVLNVARETGIYVSVPSANFTAGFSFAPQKGFLQVTRTIFTIEWNQLSLGHVGDRFSMQLNGLTVVLGSPLVEQTTQVTSFGPLGPLSDLHVGSNIVKIAVVPITSTTTYFWLLEVRLTVEYTFQG